MELRTMTEESKPNRTS